MANRGAGGASVRKVSARRGSNPLWARSPLVLRRYPGLLVAVATGALLLAVAAASSPLFLSSAAGSALEREVENATVYGAGLTVGQRDYLGQRASVARSRAPHPTPCAMRPSGRPCRGRGREGRDLELKNTINTMVDQLSSFASEVTRVAREVGTEGKLGGQAEVKGVAAPGRT